MRNNCWRKRRDQRKSSILRFCIFCIFESRAKENVRLDQRNSRRKLGNDVEVEQCKRWNYDNLLDFIGSPLNPYIIQIAADVSRLTNYDNSVAVANVHIEGKLYHEKFCHISSKSTLCIKFEYSTGCEWTKPRNYSNSLIIENGTFLCASISIFRMYHAFKLEFPSGENTLNTIIIGKANRGPNYFNRFSFECGILTIRPTFNVPKSWSNCQTRSNCS